MSTNKHIAQSDWLSTSIRSYQNGLTIHTASLVASEALRQAVVALVEQQALANRIALGNYDRDELLKQTDV